MNIKKVFGMFLTAVILGAVLISIGEPNNKALTPIKFKQTYNPVTSGN